MKQFTTQQEVEAYDERTQLEKLAQLRSIEQSEKVTAVEVIGVFALMIFLTIVLPTITAWLVGR
jgi:uncharacterized membrane protein